MEVTMNVSHSDLLDETSGIIVHGCNSKGVFGAGIAKAIRSRYNKVYLDYRREYITEGLKLGDIIVTTLNQGFIYVSGITQLDYGRDPSRVYVDYTALREVFRKVNNLALSTKLEVKFPMIGCGLGGGSLDEVQRIIQSTLDPSVKRTLFRL